MLRNDLFCKAELKSGVSKACVTLQNGKLTCWSRQLLVPQPKKSAVLRASERYPKLLSFTLSSTLNRSHYSLTRIIRYLVYSLYFAELLWSMSVSLWVSPFCDLNCVSCCYDIISVGMYEVIVLFLMIQ